MPDRPYFFHIASGHPKVQSSGCISKHLTVCAHKVSRHAEKSGTLHAQVAKLRAYHYTAQSVPEKAGLARYGLDLIKGTLRNNVDAGVIEPVLAKTKILQVPSSSLLLAGKKWLLFLRHACASWVDYHKLHSSVAWQCCCTSSD